MGNLTSLLLNIENRSSPMLLELGLSTHPPRISSTFESLHVIIVQLGFTKVKIRPFGKTAKWNKSAVILGHVKLM